MKVFLSHTSDGKELATQVANDLRGRGFEVLMDRSLFEPGEQWAPLLAEAITSSDAVIVFVASDSTSSRWQSAEIALAVAGYRGDKLIVPVLVSKHVEIPYFLRQFQALDASNPDSYQSAIELLAKVIRSSSGERMPASDAARLHRELLNAQEVALKRATVELESSRSVSSRFLLGQMGFMAGVVGLVVGEIVLVWTIGEGRLSLALLGALGSAVVGILSGIAGYYFGTRAGRESEKADPPSTEGTEGVVQR